jgi:hypothetical protein
MAKIDKENVGNLKPAPYNPRKITDKQLGMLKKSMAEFGDLSGIVRNVRTGNLVGGHQRVKNLDQSWPIEKHPATDKTGTVALGYIHTPFGDWQYREVDWPEKKEVAANVSANQQGGEFDMPKLKDIIINLDTGDMDMELLGFNSHELELMMTAVQPEFDPDAEWQGMPEVGDTCKGIKQILIHFETMKDVEDFSVFIGQKIGEKTKSIW